MPDLDLTTLRPSHQAVLVALLAHDTPVANKHLPSGGLTGPIREQLNAAGIVTTDTAGRSHTHALTAAGRDLVAALSAEAPPPLPVVRKAPTTDLSPNQILALVVLMAEARELTNTEFADLAGFSLTGADNSKLVKLGLVETDKSSRPYVHQLTDLGWRTVRTLHEKESPKEGRSAVRTLFTLLANVHRALDRLQLAPGEFFKQGPTSAAAPADVPGAVRSAYQELAKGPGEWIGLADLRDRLAAVPRPALDEALLALLREPGVRIIPVANLKGLTPRDHAAALRIGGEDSHALAIEPA